jgi:23S rRNA (adenine2503-C2)-methyltransferase
MSYLFDPEFLTQYLKEHKIPSFRAKQIQQAIYKESLLDIDEITTLSKDLREQLKSNTTINDFTLTDIIEGPETTKFLFTLADGKVIETVLMYHWHLKDEFKGKIDQRNILRSRTDHTPSFETHTLNRITICISSQVGCAVGCIFCVTWKLWFKKNLPRQEIILQILYANNYIKKKFGKKDDGTRRKVRNVVFMGMGEPMLNYDNMVTSIEIMQDQTCLGLSKRHITISTSWVADKIRKLIDDNIDVRLALSLHAPNQELRQELIPMIARRRDIDELMETIDYYTDKTGNRLFYEYIMIKGKTDTADIADQLGKLLKHRNAHVNLIPYNENPAMPDLETSDYDVILAFKKWVEKHGVTVTVRDTLGRDVKWACGQLGYEVIMKKRIEDMEAEENV